MRLTKERIDAMKERVECCQIDCIRPGEDEMFMFSQAITALEEAYALIEKKDEGMQAVASWLSAALDDDKVCAEFKADIKTFLARAALGEDGDGK